MSEQIRRSEYNMFAQGKIREWELVLKRYRREYRQREGYDPSPRQMDLILAQSIHLNNWVDDPEFEHSAAIAKEEVTEIRASLYELPAQQRMFDTFIERAVVD